MYDIITFGSSTIDVFLELGKEDYEILKDKSFSTKQGLCFSFGSKVRVNGIEIDTGGGGTNVAVTLLNQGMNVAYCGKVGNDLNGKEIIHRLKQKGLGIKFISKTNQKRSNYSVILSAEGTDRTILVYKGASEIMDKKDIPWRKIKASLSEAKSPWFYFAPLSGRLADLTGDLVDFANKNKIKVFLNPGSSQLNFSKNKLKRIIKKVDILLLNQEEASKLTGVSYKKENKIFKKLDKICPRISIMTKGSDGVMASDGKNVYKAPSLGPKIADSTGAGDSFGSGFLAGFIKSKGDIEKAIQLGVANASACLEKWGAQNGLLEKDDEFEKVKVNTKPL